MRTRIVPVKPSERMIEAGLAEIGRNPDLPDEEVCTIYADMLAAAPPVSEELVRQVKALINTHVEARWGCDSVMRYSAWIEGDDKAARAILALINGESE